MVGEDENPHETSAKRDQNTSRNVPIDVGDMAINKGLARLRALRLTQRDELKEKKGHIKEITHHVIGIIDEGLELLMERQADMRALELLEQEERDRILERKLLAELKRRGALK